MCLQKKRVSLCASHILPTSGTSLKQENRLLKQDLHVILASCPKSGFHVHDCVQVPQGQGRVEPPAASRESRLQPTGTLKQDRGVPEDASSEDWGWGQVNASPQAQATFANGQQKKAAGKEEGPKLLGELRQTFKESFQVRV